MALLLPAVSFAIALLFATLYEGIDRIQFPDTGPDNLIYLHLARGRAGAGSIAFVLLAILLWTGTRGHWWTRFAGWCGALSTGARTWLTCLVCVLAVSVIHGRALASGFFFADDFEIQANNWVTPLHESLFRFNGEHFLPLYRIEVSAITYLFGTNAVVWNLFNFGVFVSILCLCAAIFRRLGLAVQTFLVFLVIYAGSARWGEIFTTDYLLSVYSQSVLFAVVSVWAYVRWREAHRWPHAAIYGSAVTAGILVDASGIWLLPFSVLLLVCYSGMSGDTARTFFGHNRGPILALAAAMLACGAYLAAGFVINPQEFSLMTRVPGDLPSDFLRLGAAAHFLLSDGLVSSLLVPDASFILRGGHFGNHFWHAWTAWLVVASIGQVALWFTFYRKSDRSIRWLLVLALGGIVSTLSLAVLKRPGAIAAYPRLPPQFISASWLWYCLSMALVFETAMRRRAHRAGLLSGVTACLLVFAAAQVMSSFVSAKFARDARERRAFCEDLKQHLVPALEPLANVPTVIPELPGLPRDGDGRAVIGLRQCLALVPQSENIAVAAFEDPDAPSGAREAIDTRFIRRLKDDEMLRAYYLKALEIHAGSVVVPATGTWLAVTRAAGTYRVPLEGNLQGVVLEVTVPLDSRPFAIEAYADNELNVQGPLAVMKVDQYSDAEQSDDAQTRLYSVTMPFDRVYALALSGRRPNEMTFKVQDGTPSEIRVYGY
ncbi:MAG: hypothetical protein ABL971_17105 [Vicinamibacterales bacterium]